MRDLVRQIAEGYKSVKLLGQEEGYVVFSGQEPDTHQPVLIKVLPRLLGRDQQASRQLEALSRALRQLNHPNIVPVRQVGAPAGMPYVVTRAVEKGQRLAASLEQAWDVDAAADVAMQAGRALEHAYNKGVMHGTLSPESILVEDKGRVLVTDFGLSPLMELVGARVQHEASPYIAPERAAGKAASPRSDVYSLAAILYRLLAGRPPQVVKGQVLPPSRFNRDVPAGFDPVLVQALAPEPSERYADVKAFLAALGAVTLVPKVEPAKPLQAAPAATEGQTCRRCGTPNQTARFCRKCGAQLTQPAAAAAQRRQPMPKPGSKLNEPIQITHIEVGHVPVGQGVELRETVIAQPMPVATGSISADFPEPLPMPQLQLAKDGLFSSDFDQPRLVMPAPPPMPVIDWGEIAPPMPEVPTAEDTEVKQERP